jgi:hypothetical protein
VINYVEAGEGSPKVDTILRLKAAFEDAGIQFTDGMGVRYQEEILDIKKLQGSDFFARLTDDQLEVLLDAKDELLGIGISDAQIAKYAGQHMKRYFQSMSERKFKERILIETGDKFIAGNPLHYRWTPHELYSANIPYFVYGDRVAFVLFQAGRCVIIRNKILADSFRGLFNLMWKMSKPLPKNIKKKPL